MDTTNEKLMNVGGLNDNGIIAHALVPAKMVREFVCFMPSNGALRLPCKVYVFHGGRLKTEKPERESLYSPMLKYGSYRSRDLIKYSQGDRLPCVLLYFDLDC